MVGSLDSGSEVLGAVGEYGGVIDLEGRAKLGIVTQQERRLAGRLEAGTMPDDVAFAARGQVAGREVQHDLRLTRGRLDRHPERDRLRPRAGSIGDLSARVLGVALPLWRM